ncbi:MAG: signal peptide peptidase SppA [Synechococcaceae cyanobacterium SM2_3_2]|nr:signal peptide peptidase SppA [Synechococcaceae cyanobacterium SM2_3_2]
MLRRLFAGANQIARIEIEGVIDSKMRPKVLKALKKVEKWELPALVLRIDSPGGTVGDSQEIYQALQQLRSKVKIVSSFGNISASGGVYIAMGSHKIVSNPGTITGSIGVIIRGNNIERLLDKVGVSFQVIKSGPYKDILSFDRGLSPEEQRILQDLVDVTYSQFVATVASARQLPEATVRSFADGRIFSGEQALRLGLVDQLGSEEDARRLAAELAGLDPETKFININIQGSPLSRILPGGSLLQSATQQINFAIQTNGIPLWLYRP